MIDFKEIKKKFFKKENLFSIVLIITIFFIDRYSKSLILEKFSENVFYVTNFFNLNLLWNTGIGFGLLSSNSSLFYNLISGIIGAVIIFLIIVGIKADKFDKVTFSIIIGGALGNFYDRIVFKAVPDFIDIHYGSLHWFTFNIADIFITIGIFAFIIRGFFIKNN